MESSIHSTQVSRRVGIGVFKLYLSVMAARPDPGSESELIRERDCGPDSEYGEEVSLPFTQ
jgi:hypothetical protein